MLRMIRYHHIMHPADQLVCNTDGQVLASTHLPLERASLDGERCMKRDN